MRMKLKQWGCYAVIIILLPYIVTVFLNGSSIATSTNVDHIYIKVKSGDNEIEMSMEEYCIGKLAKEIPVTYEKEAVEAQAILVRTSVFKKIKEAGSSVVLEEEFWTTEEMKNSWGASKYKRNYEKLEDAWHSTEGKVLMYEDNLVHAPFCRLTNGSTRDGKEVLGSEEYPYLKIKDCHLDIESKEQIQTVVLDDMDVEITGTDTAGYVTTVRVGQDTINGEEFRDTYHLVSSCFTIQKYDGKVRITTRGVGHGLGMSQYTANEMAKTGSSAEEILAYFFEGTEIKEVADIVTEVE